MLITRLALVALFTLPAAISLADELAQIIDSGSNNTGVLSINQAAGEQNQQANLRALSVSSSVSQGHTQILQSITSPALESSNSRAVIGDNAFSHNHGLIGINQSAGQQNQSVNSAAISVSGQVVGTPIAIQDQLLAISSGNSQSSNNDIPTGSAQTLISPTAFQGSRGVIQINQIAGSQNRAANLLTVQWVSPQGH